MERIEHIEARCWRVPLDETLHDAKHGAHTHFELITVRVLAVVSQRTNLAARPRSDVWVS